MEEGRTGYSEVRRDYLSRAPPLNYYQNTAGLWEQKNFTFTCTPYHRYGHGIGDEAADLIDVPWTSAKFQLASHLSEARILLAFFTLSRNVITRYQTN